MTATRHYTCDLCNMGNDAANLVGIYWTTLNPKDKSYWGRERAVERPAREVEHHLCQKCLDDIAEIIAARRLRA